MMPVLQEIRKRRVEYGESTNEKVGVTDNNLNHVFSQKVQLNQSSKQVPHRATNLKYIFF
jgi:hypothetical protein